jgi:hypothetical protein
MAFDPSRVTYTLRIEPEYIPLEGNVLASGNDAEDKAAENDVRTQLRAGNEWAWCCVTVEAHYPDFPFVGRDTLGACSYASEADFTQPGGYFDDMKAEALRDLTAQVDGIREALCNS